MRSTSQTPARLPRALPLLGHALHLLRDPLTFVTAARPLGDVVKIRIGSQPAYLVNNSDLIRQVLVKEAKKYSKGVQLDKVRPTMGNGLLTAGGQEHLKHRRLVQPAFHHSRIAGYAAIMRELALRMTESWRDGQCIGEEVAWTEAVIVLVTVASRWRMRPVPGVTVRMRPLTTLRPSELPMIPELRQYFPKGTDLSSYTQSRT